MNMLNAIFGKKEEVGYKELVKKGAIILDVRSEAEFNGGHVKGAINIPLDVLSRDLKKIGKDNYIITCCLSGARSGMAKNILIAAGYNNVINGGGWSSLNNKLQ